jgi:MFS superfamily sulfate permease-like transporter
VGQVVRQSVDKGASGENDDVMNARIAGVVTGMAGAIIFVAGLTRLGYLESVLSRPFLRGFISAIGFLIFVDQLIPEMGLSDLANESGIGHGSTVDKIWFLFRNLSSAHALTCWVSFGSFGIIMVFRSVSPDGICRLAITELTPVHRTLKRRLQPRLTWVAYIPDRFMVVALAAVFTWACGWERKGLDILGDVKSSTGSAFPFHWPFIPTHMTHVREAMSTSFLIALLGFFESSVAAKALGSGGELRSGEALEGISLSPNRELVALGVANLVGGCFMALPAFGGYGRSKVNAQTGGRTPMSSIFLSVITFVCILFLMPYFYYIPVRANQESRPTPKLTTER